METTTNNTNQFILFVSNFSKFSFKKSFPFKISAIHPSKQSGGRSCALFVVDPKASLLRLRPAAERFRLGGWLLWKKNAWLVKDEENKMKTMDVVRIGGDWWNIW